MNPEYMPWYHPGSAFLRCAGDAGCGALVVEGDIELHNKFHKRLREAERQIILLTGAVLDENVLDSPCPCGCGLLLAKGD